MDAYGSGFEECEDLRSTFMRSIILRQIHEPMGTVDTSSIAPPVVIPKRLVRYWHDRANVPEDVRACFESWDSLVDEGFEIHTFDDNSAAAYIRGVYGEHGLKAFMSCDHPAMRCDYLRMCYILAEGGLYVDADDVLIGDGWKDIFCDGRLKVQPLCYNIKTRGMLPPAEIWNSDLSICDLIFYANNDPIAAPPGHSVLLRALVRATRKLLCDFRPEIQSTTGPGNFTAALVSHAHHLELAGLPFDFELLRDWDSIAEMRWDLSYRKDSRNWRNVYGC